MKDKYMLEIYEPNSSQSCWVVFKSETPFQTITKGDIINPGFFPDATVQKVLRVESVEHIVWSLETGEPKHKLCVYTKEIDDTWESRFPNG